MSSTVVANLRVSLSLKVLGARHAKLIMGPAVARQDRVRLQSASFAWTPMLRSRSRACGYSLTHARCRREDKILAAQDIQDMKTTVARWREKHVQFMTKEPIARHAARLQVRSHILAEESVKTTSEKNISDHMILNKTRSKTIGILGRVRERHGVGGLRGALQGASWRARLFRRR